MTNFLVMHPLSHLHEVAPATGLSTAPLIVSIAGTGTKTKQRIAQLLESLLPKCCRNVDRASFNGRSKDIK
jgi:hypothetical protein